jgi:peptidoglycan/xylan/chitin deacetylase (PgdA/CDA1 family)
MKILITVDVEEDCPPYLKTTRGVEEGLPKLLDLFKEEKIPSTFFFTAEIAERFPDTVKEVIKKGHELGSHSLKHERLDRMEKEQAESYIKSSIERLREFYDVVSFRAPNLQLPDYLFPILEDSGILIDSSKASYKGWRDGIKRVGKVLEVPVSITSSALRLPWPV